MSAKKQLLFLSLMMAWLMMLSGTAFYGQLEGQRVVDTLKQENNSQKEQIQTLDNELKHLKSMTEKTNEKVGQVDQKVGQVDQKVQTTLSSRSGLPKAEPAPESRITPRAEPKPQPKASLSARATAYGASVQNGGAGTWKTAMGTRPVEGRTIAVDPRIIPLGSKVIIECATFPSVNGTYVAEDTGGAINGNRIDIYMEDGNRSRMLQFGIRDIVFTVLH